ncbi:Mannose-6-phosphate isomerase, cupin superfamily [Halogranum amylolyticum]|uniref:Mannose-6-phosphate isomerase, cupin superfamily n=1 Tax=Halogranum amylolyticum TaxID=660520 RepID=A0A1H8NAX0_9EURY|nr:cupin domain-containing protein [Halogranum amylolyticum]SEO26686.1 Mannose-6-phosphate isomerase, cupin superfamily [Halogranum amylolyticum]
MERVPLDSVEPTEAVPGVHLAQLAVGDEMSVQHFEIDPDEEVPVHNHHHEQTGYIVEGELTFLVGDDGEEVVVAPGDSYVIPSDEPHGAENRGDVPVRGIDVFSPPRTNPDWQE